MEEEDKDCITFVSPHKLYLKGRCHKSVVGGLGVGTVGPNGMKGQKATAIQIDRERERERSFEKQYKYDLKMI